VIGLADLSEHDVAFTAAIVTGAAHKAVAPKLERE
jgi:hypothetical protein